MNLIEISSWTRRGFLSLLWLVGVVMLTSCASKGVKNPSGTGVTEMRADEKGFVGGTGIESQDLVAVTDKMVVQVRTDSKVKMVAPA